VKVRPGETLSNGFLRARAIYTRGTYIADLRGPIAGGGYSQLDVADTVDLSASTLQVSRGYGPPAGTQFTIVKLRAAPSHAVVGTFAGLPEGAEFVVSSQRFRISYHGGDGNDIVLTAVEDPPMLTINDVNNPQSTQANVTMTYLLDSGQTVTMPKIVPANGRLTIDIETESDARLHDAAVSTVVTSDLPYRRQTSS
jgi:hypothetical protein